MASRHVIEIDAEGRLTFVYDDELADLLQLGETDVRRASRVEHVAGGWEPDMAPVGGPVLPVERLRRDALASERAWLEKRLIDGRHVESE